jgi:steroid delta-isomerase-like uncharacterized protein
VSGQPSSALPAETGATPAIAPRSPAERHLAAVKEIAAAVDAHDGKRMAALYAPDAVVTVIPGAGEVRGREAIARDQDAFFKAFPDLRFAVRRVWLTDAVAVAEWVMNATHTGDFQGLRATGQRVGQPSLSILFFDDAGFVKGEHLYYDGATLIAQLAGQPGVRPIPPLPVSTEVYVARGTPDEARNVDLGRALYRAWEHHDESTFLAMLADDYVLDAAIAPTIEGKADAKREFERLTATFPDQTYEITNAWGIDRFAIFEYGMRGTHKGRVGALPATGRPIDWHWVQILEMRDGKVARAWGYANVIELMAQLGAFEPEPPPPSAEPRQR